MGPTAGQGETLLLVAGNGRIPLGFAREASTVFLVARDRTSLWPVGLLRDGTAELTIGEARLRGVVELVTDAKERERVLGLFLAKYGPERFRGWYEAPARVLRVILGGEIEGRGPGTPGYYRWLRDEFDNVAADYDRHILGNRINRLLRDRSLSLLEERFQGARRLLEVGCGSGMETLPLLRAGHEVVAVDISSRMLEVVRSKARAEGLSERLSTVERPAREIDRLLPEFGAGSFDGAYSTYGALNCEPDLAPIPSALHELLRPSAGFVAGIYNRWCLFELVGYSLSGQPARALGRRRNPVPVGASRFCVDVYAHSLSDIRRRFGPWFRFERVEGVPVFLPPSDLVNYAEKFARRFERLASWDRWAGRLPGLRALGDHFLASLGRR